MARSSIPRRPKFSPLSSLKDSRPMPAGYYAKPHTHGCRQCQAVIPTCKCLRPERDPLCVTCEIGRRRSWSPEERRPRDCCRDHWQPVRQEVKRQFLLAGQRAWYRCEVCRRFFAHRPDDPAQDPPIELDDWVARFGPLPEPPTTAAEWAALIRGRSEE